MLEIHRMFGVVDWSNKFGKLKIKRCYRFITSVGVVSMIKSYHLILNASRHIDFILQEKIYQTIRKQRMKKMKI